MPWTLQQILMAEQRTLFGCCIKASLDRGAVSRITIWSRATESYPFLLMSSGEKGEPYILKGSYFYRIIDRFIDQTGVDRATSIYGGQFKDDPGGLKLQVSVSVCVHS